MPYRNSRRRAKPRRKAKARQIAFRTGHVSASGRGKPFISNTKSYFARCATTVVNSGTSSGDIGTFDIREYNMPLNMSEKLTWAYAGTATTEGLRHPTGHTDAIAQGFDTATVKSVMYRFNVQWTGTGGPLKNYVFAYKFAPNSFIAEPVLTAGASIVNEWNDMRQSRGWVYKRFSGTGVGGDIYPSGGIIDVKIPSVAKLCYAFAKGQPVSDDQNVNNPFDMPIHDTTSLNQEPKYGCFLHFVVLNPSGQAMTAQDITVDIDWFAKCVLHRKKIEADMITDIQIGGTEP